MRKFLVYFKVDGNKIKAVNHEGGRSTDVENHFFNSNQGG
jgi:hypothetical protein